MKRVFVVGFPRSGTTLLQSLLGAHPDLSTFPESQLLSRAFYSFPRLGFVMRKRRQLPVLETFLASVPEIDDQDVSLRETFRRLDRRPLFFGSAPALPAIALFDAIAQARQTRGWLEKSPEHLVFWRLLSDAAPEAQFIHMARRPVDAVASYCSAARNWGRAPTQPLVVSRRWNHRLRISVNCIGKPSHHFVTYERLAADPINAAERLARAIGLSAAPGFASNYRDVARDIVLPRETHKARNREDIRVENRTAEYLTPQQISLVERTVDTSLYDRFEQASDL